MVAGLLGKAGAGAVSLVAVDFKHACALALIQLRRRVELCVRELVLSPNPATRITVQVIAKVHFPVLDGKFKITCEKRCRVNTFHTTTLFSFLPY